MHRFSALPFLLVLALGSITPALASGELVHPLSEADTNLTAQQLAYLEALKSAPTTASVKIITTNARALPEADGDVTIDLGDGLKLVFPRSGQDVPTAQFIDENNFAWDAVGTEGKATASVSVTNGEVDASIRTDSRIFRIASLGEDVAALVEVRPAAFPPEHPATAESGGALEDNADINEADLKDEKDTSVADISVLVVATPSAKAFIPNLDNFAKLGANVSNQSFVNSDVHIVYHIAGTAVADGYVEAGSHQDDLSHLAVAGDGQLDFVQNLRAQDHADFVMLLTNDHSNCGLARQIYASAATAYVTVDWSCAVDNLSFPHELGHLLGACHNTENSSGCPFAYGHGFIDHVNHVRTIMAYPCAEGGCVRMPQWSRPPNWGDASLRNDARVLNQTSARASKFF